MNTENSHRTWSLIRLKSVAAPRLMLRVGHVVEHRRVVTAEVMMVVMMVMRKTVVVKMMEM